MIGLQVARARGVSLLDVHNVGAGGLVFRFHKIIERITARFGKTVAEQWTRALIAYKGYINQHQLVSAIASGNLRQVEAVVNAHGLQRQLEKAMQDPLLRAMQTAGRASAAALSARGIDASFNAVHPNVVLWARTRSAELVTSIPEDVRETIRLVIAYGASGRLAVDEQARMIKEVIGLPRNWVLAPLRFGDELREKMLTDDTTLGTIERRLSGADMVQVRSRVEAGTLTDDFINDMEATYSERLISLRAETIARTESLSAANHGVQEQWSQSIADGTLSDQSKQFWIVTPDDRLCPICVEIPGMNPDGVGVDEMFETPEGPVDAPPAPHPNCRCSIGLIVDGASQADIEAATEGDIIPVDESIPIDEAAAE